MAKIDMNGYNATFRAFVDFAEKAARTADGGKTIATATPALGGRKIKVAASETDMAGFKGGLVRTSSEMAVNNKTRDIFLASVIQMFGGEDKIPSKVMKALKTGDYYSGKPLTARRIMAVKDAIDKTGILFGKAKVQMTAAAKALSDKTYGKFDDPATKEAAKAFGFTEAQMVKVAKATRFTAMALGVSEAEALKQVAEPDSKPNRLLQYGGRFLDTPTNFKDGLRLLDEFQTWFADVREWHCKNTRGLNTDYSTADTPTKLNCTSLMTANKDEVLGLEAMAFDEMAVNPSLDLRKGGEALFGFANNAAVRFAGRGFHKTCFGTVLNIPPEKRRVLFAAFDAFAPLSATKEDAASRQGKKIFGFANGYLISRVLKHFDKIESMLAKGPLDAREVFKACFPEVKLRNGADPLKAIQDFDDGVDVKCNRDFEPGAYFSVRSIMTSTGCTYKEAANAYRKGERPAYLPYATGYSMELQEYGDGARHQAVSDLTRPANYTRCDKNGMPIEDSDFFKNGDGVFQLRFADGEKFSIGAGPAHAPAAEKALDKVELLCGKANQKQIKTVMLNLTQGANAQLNKGLLKFGINSNEHSVLNYDITRDEATGAVTIKTSGPESLPVHFEWTTTVDTDGHCVSTPMTVRDNVLTKAGCKELVAGAVESIDRHLATDVEKRTRLGWFVKLALDKRQTARAEKYLHEYGADLTPRCRKILANYIVLRGLTSATERRDRAAIKSMADSMAKWRDFGYDDPRMQEICAAIATHADGMVQEELGEKGDKDYHSGYGPTIFKTFAVDAPRHRMYINGKAFEGDDAGPCIEAFKKAVKGDAAQKALSIFMSQTSGTQLLFTSNHIPFEPNAAMKNGVPAPHTLLGADMLVNRAMDENHLVQLISGNGRTYHLEVSKDGKTARVRTEMDTDLVFGGNGTTKENPKSTIPIGKASIKEEFVFDLSGKTPKITSVRLSQTFDA